MTGGTLQSFHAISRHSRDFPRLLQRFKKNINTIMNNEMNNERNEYTGK